MCNTDHFLKGLNFTTDFILNVEMNVPVIDNQIEHIKNLINQVKGLVHAHVEYQAVFAPTNDVIVTPTIIKATETIIKATQDADVTNVVAATDDVVIKNTSWADDVVDDQSKTDDDNNAWGPNVPHAIRIAATHVVEQHVDVANPPFIQVRPVMPLMLRPARVEKIILQQKKTTVFFTDNFGLGWDMPNEISFVDYNISTDVVAHKQMCHRKNGKIFVLTVRGVPFLLDINRNLYFMSMSERRIKKYTNEMFVDDNNKHFNCADKWVSAIKPQGAIEYTQGYFDHGDVVYDRSEFVPKDRHAFVMYN